MFKNGDYKFTGTTALDPKKSVEIQSLLNNHKILLYEVHCSRITRIHIHRTKV